MQVRLQTWFPFGVHVVLNGREWLARQLDAARIGYVRRDNCLAAIADFTRAQKLADRQRRIDWPKHLDRLVRRGEYQITGLRNRDLRQAWYGETTDAAQRRKQSSAISRKLSLLRAHGLIQKVPHTHRYLLTKTGVTAIAALLAARNANVNQLTPAA